MSSGPGFDTQLPQKISEEKSIDVAQVNQRGWSEESGRRLENVDQAHLVMACGYSFQLTNLKDLLMSGVKPSRTATNWYQPLELSTSSFVSH